LSCFAVRHCRTTRKNLDVLYTKPNQVRVFVHVFCCHSIPLADLPQGASKNCEIITFIQSSVYDHKLYSVNLQLLLHATVQVEVNVGVPL